MSHPPCLWYASAPLTFDWPWCLSAGHIFCQSENSPYGGAWAGLGGTQRRVIAADRKYQAFNYQQCYHIIATNKSVTTELRWGGERPVERTDYRFCYVNSRHGRQKNSINFWIILMSQLSSILLCLVNYGPETTRSNYFKQTFKLFHFGPRLCFHCSAEI